MKSHGDSFFFPPSPGGGGGASGTGSPHRCLMSFPFPPGRLPRPTGPHYTSARGSRAPPAAAGTARPEPAPAPQLRAGRGRRLLTPLQAGQRRGPRLLLLLLPLPAGSGSRSAAARPRRPSPGTHLGVSGGGGCRARARPMWLRPRLRAADAPPAKGARPAGRLRPSGSGTLPGCRGRQGPRRRLLRRRFLRAGIIAALGTGPGTISPPFAPAPSCRHRARPAPRRRGQSPRASLGRPHRLRACARPRSARREL